MATRWQVRCRSWKEEHEKSIESSYWELIFQSEVSSCINGLGKMTCHGETVQGIEGTERNCIVCPFTLQILQLNVAVCTGSHQFLIITAGQFLKNSFCMRVSRDYHLTGQDQIKVQREVVGMNIGYQSGSLAFTYVSSLNNTQGLEFTYPKRNIFWQNSKDQMKSSLPSQPRLASVQFNSTNIYITISWKY